MKRRVKENACKVAAKRYLLDYRRLLDHVRFYAEYED